MNGLPLLSLAAAGILLLSVVGAAGADPAAPAASSLAPETIAQALDISPVWAGTYFPYALLTHGSDQFVAFYDDQRRMTVGRRKLTDTRWQLVRLPETVVWDSHNSIALTMDNQGLLHLAGNMHAVPLVYFRTAKPLDIATFQRVPRMTGQDEDKVTYPLFFRGPGNALIFTYRAGYSGNGNQIYNIWDAGTQTWHRLLDKPFTDGEGKRNAYFANPVVGPDGFYHLVWIWRETGDAATSHDPCYARSRDLIHWEKSGGSPLTLPITLGSSEIVDAVPQHGGAINNNVKIGFDGQGRPVVSFHKYDAQGHTQIYNARREAGGWRVYQISDWNWRWDFGGGGTLIFELHVFPVQSHPDGTLTQAYATLHHGSGDWLLDAATLKPLRLLAERPAYPPALSAAASAFPGMQVNWQADGGDSGKPGVRYVLRWESLPENRDKPYPGPLPPPSLLRLYTLSSVPAP